MLISWQSVNVGVVHVSGDGSHGVGKYIVVQVGGGIDVGNGVNVGGVGVGKVDADKVDVDEVVGIVSVDDVMLLYAMM